MTTDRIARAHRFLARAADPENSLIERKLAAQSAAIGCYAPSASRELDHLAWHEALRRRDPELHVKLGPLVQSGLPLSEENCALWLETAREFVAFVEAREVAR